jgi:hypothetical protein
MVIIIIIIRWHPAGVCFGATYGSRVAKIYSNSLQRRWIAMRILIVRGALSKWQICCSGNLYARQIHANNNEQTPGIIDRGVK